MSVIEKSTKEFESIFDTGSLIDMGNSTIEELKLTLDRLKRIKGKVDSFIEKIINKLSELQQEAEQEQ